MERTLVILTGNPRGNEIVWKSMYDHLMNPYNADLALCFEYQEDKTSSLYSTAKYLWEVPKYDDWEEYYVTSQVPGRWKEVFDWTSNDPNGQAFSGIGKSKGKGSGAILLAFRHYLLNNHKEEMLEYDRIILTRSDYFYLFDQPILSNEYYWVPNGESYGGISDRYQQFPTKYLDESLSVIDYLSTEHCFEEYVHRSRLLNIEQAVANHLYCLGLTDKIKAFDRCNFIVTTDSLQDQTFLTPYAGCWDFPGSEKLKIKYIGEWHQASSNFFKYVFEKEYKDFL